MSSGWTSSGRETREYELNEVSWWAKWVDETVWVSKNCYAVFSDAFGDEWFFNRGGFVGAERVPKLVVGELEKEFRGRRRVPYVLVEEGRGWGGVRASLSSKGYVAGDRMVVMERASPVEVGPKTQSAEVTVLESKGRELGEWTRTYLRAFYGETKLSEVVGGIMREVVDDDKASVLLARVGGAPAGCAVVQRSGGGIAGVYCVGTDPKFRRKGVAAAVLHAAMEEAGREGRRLILQTMASDGLEDFYLKQGFGVAYSKVVYARAPTKGVEGRPGASGLPSGERFGVRINRAARAGATEPFSIVFNGFERVGAVKSLFGMETEKVISRLKISLSSTRGYLRVDGETGDVLINPEYLRTGDERHLYLDAIHELTHVKQFMQGRELYDRSYAYFERPTEVEAYRKAVEEAKRIGMNREEIVEYLRVDWVAEEEFQRFVAKVLAAEG